MSREDFVPFFQKKNNERKVPSRAQSTFPNYMNWYVSKEQVNKDQIQRNAFSFQSGGTYQYRMKKDPIDYSPIDTSKQLYKETRDNPVLAENIRDDSDLMQRRKERHQAIRKELADYQAYRLRQPFKRSEVPSIWTQKRQAQHQDAVKKQTKKEKQINKIAKKTVKNGNSIKSQKNHLNRGLADIMSQENSGKHTQAFLSDFNRRKDKK